MATEAAADVWRYEADQFCDDGRFVNGNLGSKCVGIVGLGQIGRRIAAWCTAMGAQVLAHDPFVSPEAARSSGARLTDLDDLIDRARILFIAVPPTPSAERMVSRERIGRLGRGAIVVIVTRALAVDMAALRERIVADELVGAFDVYDVEPVPEDDPLRGRDNVVHLPHIAGRTRDSNLQVVDVIVDDFARILRGESPRARLTADMIDIRLHRKPR